MAALTLSIFSLLVSTTIAIEDFQNTQFTYKEEWCPFQTLPLQLNADRKQFYFQVYFHEIFTGPNSTTTAAANPNSDFPNFGEILIMDVPLWGHLNGTNLIARLQGVATQSDQKTFGWHLSFHIEFELPALKGSTLMGMGRALQLTTPREFAIVGGTGVFSLATGQMYGRKLSSLDENELWIEFKIVGYYTPMKKPDW
ncbi:Dirigent protein [Rhynchospora pubera]|uniref:Dirigent protein n=1 Tax=Rhynchospora pubera TaxID=906938 RepID=A0AAV8AI74_9POAL|nr:Dirigent protein [Rhynchospora pubera]KAJ4788627.1 Dirigent protein [Rhynchospora pubera]